jgi:hypothetical protein
MNTYAAIWNGQQIEIAAETTYQAQQAAAIAFQAGSRKKVKGYEIAIALIAISGQAYVNSAAII